MSKLTPKLKMYLPEDTEFYNVAQDQNDNFAILDKFAQDTEDDITALEKNKSDNTHIHDDRYYTEPEIDNMFKKYCPYSVDDILVTTSAIHPATRWIGTTWIRITDRVLMGAGNLYAVNSQGGADTVQLSIANMPSHLHGYSNSVNWAHNHYYYYHINWNHIHRWNGSFNWTHTHYYSNSINWSHNHGTGSHAHTVGDHQHVVPWGESNGQDAPWGTWGSGRYGSGDSDHDNLWRMTSPAGAQWTSAAAPATTWSGGVSGFSGNTGSAGGVTNVGGNTTASGEDTKGSGYTQAAGGSTSFNGNTTAQGSNQAFSILNPYYAVYIWRRTA